MIIWGKHFEVAAGAATVADSGTCGVNVTWKYDNSGTLTVSGTGKMLNFIIDSEIPWAAYKKSIRKAVIGSGVTGISPYSFSDCPLLTSVTIPNTVTSIGDNAFACCSNLNSITIPNGATSIMERDRGRDTVRHSCKARR